MSGHHDIDKSVKLYWRIFFALMILTVITVGASYLSTSVTVAIVIALAIASFKVSLVLNYFMHLNSEKPIIIWVLILTLFFFAVLMLIPALWHIDGIRTL